MENKEIIKLPASGSQVGLQWFLFTWMKENVVGVLNKLWVVQLPPNTGTALVRDSMRKVTIDLSQVNLINEVQIVNDGSAFVDISGTINGNKLVLTFAWTTTDCA